MVGFKTYVPGLSIDEIKDRYGLTKVIKMASNENIAFCNIFAKGGH